MRALAAVSILLATACSSSLRPVPEAWRTVPEAARITDLCARVTCAERSKTEGVRIAGGKLLNGKKELTPPFAAIQSFDVSTERGEVVFSARRADNFDVGLVSLDGSQINWFPSDRADETDVRWAPRGNKVSYVVRTPRGDIVRTLHVPTSMQLVVDFTTARVVALAWDPPAERYAVVVESPEASQRVESARYGGEERRVVVPPAERLDIAAEPLAGALVVRPSAMRYNEKLPLVVWQDADPLRWSDARAALLRNARVAIAIVSTPPSEAFWTEVKNTKWIDSERIYGVGLITHHSSLITSIAEDPSVPNGFYRAEGREVRTRGIQSFAAGYIAHELKTNGLR
jgi:hypothetical protein